MALLAVFLYSFLPPVLAHAGLATTDMPLTAMLAASFVTGIMWLERPTTRRSVLFGACTGLAILSKFSIFAFLPAAALAALLCYLAAARPASARSPGPHPAATAALSSHRRGHDSGDLGRIPVLRRQVQFRRTDAAVPATLRRHRRSPRPQCARPSFLPVWKAQPVWLVVLLPRDPGREDPAAVSDPALHRSRSIAPQAQTARKRRTGCRWRSRWGSCSCR